MDALTHAVEAYIGNSTTPGTRKDALMATECALSYLLTVLQIVPRNVSDLPPPY